MFHTHFLPPAGEVVIVGHIGFVQVGIVYRTEIWISGNATSFKLTWIICFVSITKYPEYLLEEVI